MLDHIEIIHQDQDLLVVNKPHGLLVHRTAMAKDATTSLLKILRKQLEVKLYPIHRLDRKTSGVMLIGLNPKTLSTISEQFRERKVLKKYHAVVRGFINQSGTIDYAIKNEKGKLKEACTHYKLLKQYEIDVPLGKHETSRYSLVELIPETGRYHQLRMHMAHIFHPIIGDRPHGCNKQNRLFKEKFEMNKMLLHAKSIEFKRDNDACEEKYTAEYSDEFRRVLQRLENEKGILS